MADSIGGSQSALQEHNSASIYMGTDQTISHSTVTKVQMDTADANQAYTDGITFEPSNYRLKVEEDGVYWISGTIKWASDATTSGWSTGDRTLSRIHVNGSQKVNAEIPKTGTYAQSCSTTGFAWDMKTGDTVSMHCFQNSGNSQNLKGTKSYCRLSVVEIGRLSP